MALLRKIADTFRFLRYGPTRLQAAQERQEATSTELHRQEREVGELRGFQAYAAAQLTEMREHLNSLQQAVGVLQQDVRRESEWTRNQLNGLVAALDRQRAAAPDTTARPPSEAAAEETFYPTLEKYFRGSAADVRARLGAYRRWVDGLPAGPVADLGCGRGEWLELLGEWGLAARGIDLNALNVRDLRERGLDAEQADLMQWLRTQPDASFAAITSFHVIEHLPFGMLLRLIQEARRVLLPGGLLILETPNPENVIVATQTFWLDPSHVRPLPPALLEVLVRDAGLELEALLRLNPPAEDGHDISDATLRALMTQGRDCAVVARKPAVASE